VLVWDVGSLGGDGLGCFVPCVDGLIFGILVP
jgi:hypothetical protein